MSTDFPDREKWLALRSTQPRPERVFWNRGTYCLHIKRTKRKWREEHGSKGKG